MAPISTSQLPIPKLKIPEDISQNLIHYSDQRLLILVELA